MSLSNQGNSHNDSKSIFLSGHSRAQWVIVLMMIVIIIDILAIIFDIMQIQLVTRIQAGGLINEAEAIANDSRQATMGTIYLVAFIVTALAFCLWMHRAYRNLPALGARELKYSPAWAVGGFFIPVLSLFRPYQVTKEIWQASDPNIASVDGTEWKNAPDSIIIFLWWVLFILSSIAGYVMLRMSLTAETINDFISLSTTTLVIDIIDVPAAVLAIVLVRTIDQRQRMKNEKTIYINKGID